MARPDRIVGLAIVSAEGMIADARGLQPDSLKIEADQRFFHATLGQAAAVVHGRCSGEGGPAMTTRPRLILTRSVAALARDPQNAVAVHWNPAGASLEKAWAMLGLSGGALAVIGGTDPFGLFLGYGYDVFHLSRARRATLPGGRPVFPGVPGEPPESLLARHGLKPDATRVLDESAGLTLETWRRQNSER
jgi:hypothetical protein